MWEESSINFISAFCSQIHSDQFKSDAMVHGYSAVLQYLMWKKEVWLEGGAGTEKTKVLCKQALEHFVTVGEVSTKPCHAMDIFISTHSQVNVVIALGYMLMQEHTVTC